MSERTTWAFLLTGICIGLAVFFQVPQLLYQMQPEAQGVLVHLTSDEYQYLARVQQALSGDLAGASEPYLGDPSVQGVQFALLEQIYGVLFGWTGLRAAVVLQILDSVITPFTFLLLFFFFRLASFSLRLSLFGAFAFIVPLLYSLQRPVHQGGSFLLVLFAFVLLIQAVRQRNLVLSMCGGAVTGLLVGTYFWSWTYAWAFAGLLLLCECVAWFRSSPRGSFFGSRAVILLLGACVAVLCAAPYVFALTTFSHHALYEATVFRSGLHASRLPESVPYSVLFFVMAISSLIAWYRHPVALHSKRFVILATVAACVVLNQQMIHGQILQFASHYAFPLAFGAVCALMLAATRISKWLSLSGLCALVFLGGVTLDNRHVISQFTILESRFQEQHFSTLLPVLDALPRTHILSDVYASAFIAGSTDHDIVYSIYLQNALLSHEEIAERYCLTQIPFPPEFRQIEKQELLVYPESNRTYPESDARVREVTMVEAACERFDRDPVLALRSYGIEYILFDEKRQPQWELSRFGTELSETARGEGWSLWRVDYE